MEGLRVLETWSDDELASAIDEPSASVLPGGGPALRKLPCELECGRNRYPAGDVDEPMFPVDSDK